MKRFAIYFYVAHDSSSGNECTHVNADTPDEALRKFYVAGAADGVTLMHTDIVELSY
jgi:hypothetical protein